MDLEPPPALLADADAGPRRAGRTAAGDGAIPLTSDLDALTHAVANALNTITAASELADLLLARNDASAAAKPLARIGPECMRAARLLREGRAFATFRIGPAYGPVDVTGLVHACADGFGGHVEVSAAAASPALNGDAQALRRAFMEILRNAFQFGAERVQATIQVSDPGQILRVAFRDDGTGTTLPADRLFQPFFSTSPEDHSGLGLALAARVADAHRGTIGLESADRGCLVWLELPFATN